MNDETHFIVGLVFFNSINFLESNYFKFIESYLSMLETVTPPTRNAKIDFSTDFFYCMLTKKSHNIFTKINKQT